MSKKEKQIHSVTDHQLEKLVGQGTYTDAEDAWNRADEIRKSGGLPRVFHSEFNGFTVFDGNDSNPETVRQLLSYEQRSKPFPS